MTVVGELLRSVAAHGLSGAQGPWPAEPLDDGDWAELLHRVRQQRLAGLLVHAAARGALPVSREQMAQARSEHLQGVCVVMALEAGVLEVVARLASAGVQARVLKGPAVAHLDYPDPALRLFGDIDLIVASHQFDVAVATLAAAGYERRHREPRPGFDRRFSKGTSFLTPQGLEIDLHRTFVMGPFGLRVDLADLWAGRSEFRLGGTTLHALDAEVRFLHACFHAALGDVVPRLVPQRDVAQMLQNERMDFDRVEELMLRWQAEPVVARAVAHTCRTLRLPGAGPLVEWALGYAPSRRSLRELDLYSDPRGSYTRKSLGALRAIPGVRAKATFAYALAVPQASYVQGRYASFGRRWWKGLRDARRTGSPS